MPLDDPHLLFDDALDLPTNEERLAALERVYAAFMEAKDASR